MTSQELVDVVRVIHTTVRCDEHSECWTIRRWLDKHGQFNGDIGSRERLIEIACAHVLSEALCPSCGGKGEIELSRDVRPSEATGGMSEATGYAPCEQCGGSGVHVVVAQ